MSCKSCTQFTGKFCTQLAATLKTAWSKGGHHVKAAWCNDEYLVISADGSPQYDAATYLKDIPQPPEGNAGCRVRTAAAQLHVYKIPLNGIPEGYDVSVAKPLPNIPGMPATGAIGVAIDGVPIFPNYNSRGIFTWTSCEVDRCNAHSEKGGDYHYHGDPYGPDCLYTEADYSGSAATAHPSIIGFAFDGYTIYGRYTQAGQEGQSKALDVCGAHTHTTYGYHYHPEVSKEQTTSLDGTNVNGTVEYTAYKGAPMSCWGGSTRSIDNFWNMWGNKVNYDSTKDGLSRRTDLDQLKPCCGMTHFYRAPGIVISGSSGSGIPFGTGTTAGGAVASSGKVAGVISGAAAATRPIQLLQSVVIVLAILQ